MSGDIQGVKEPDNYTSSDFFLDTLQACPATQEFLESVYPLVYQSSPSICIYLQNLPKTLAVINNVVVSQNHKYSRE